MSEKLQSGLLAGSEDFSIPLILRSTEDNTEATGKCMVMLQLHTGDRAEYELLL